MNKSAGRRRDWRGPRTPCVTCWRGLCGGEAERRQALSWVRLGVPLGVGIPHAWAPQHGAGARQGSGSVSWAPWAWPLSRLACILLVAGKVQQTAPGVTLTVRTSRTKGLLPAPAKGDGHLLRICPWSWGLGLSLPRHTEPGLDTWRRGRVGRCPVTCPPGQQCPGEGSAGSGERADRAVQPVRPPWERKTAECGAQQDVWRRGHLGRESGGQGRAGPEGASWGRGSPPGTVSAGGSTSPA